MLDWALVGHDSLPLLKTQDARCLQLANKRTVFPIKGYVGSSRSYEATNGYIPFTSILLGEEAGFQRLEANAGGSINRHNMPSKNFRIDAERATPRQGPLQIPLH